MKKNLLTLLLTLCLLVMAAPVFAAEDGSPDLVATDKLTAVENALYGTTQAGSLMARAESLETDIYGVATENPILERIDRIYNYITGESDNASGDSFLLNLNAVDAKFNNTLTTGPAKSRVEKLETLIYGQPEEGSLTSRISKLAEAGYSGGTIPTETVILPKDSLLQVEFTEELSSRTAKAGDPIHFVLADNVFVNDVLVLPKGAAGVGEVKKVVQPRSFGRDARIDLEFSHVYAADGSIVKVTLGELSKQKAESVAGAAGAAIGGAIVLGPVGVIGGAFVTGSQVVLAAGSTTYIQTNEDKSITGIVYPVDYVEEAATPYENASELQKEADAKNSEEELEAKYAK